MKIESKYLIHGGTFLLTQLMLKICGKGARKMLKIL